MGSGFLKWFSIRPGRRGNRRKSRKAGKAGVPDAKVSAGKGGAPAGAGLLGSGLSSSTKLDQIKPWVVLIPCAAFAVGFAIAGYAISRDVTNGNGLLVLPVLFGGGALAICLRLSRRKPRKRGKHRKPSLASTAEPVKPARPELVKPAPAREAAPPERANPAKPVEPEHKPNTVHLKPIPKLEARQIARGAPIDPRRSAEPEPAPPPSPKET
jgi:hypothetical protein